MNDQPRRAGAHLVLQAHSQAEVVLQIAVAGLAAGQAEEELTVRCAGEPVTATEVAMAYGGACAPPAAGAGPGDR